MKLFVLMLVVLNPFSQVVYLFDLMKKLTPREFASVHAKATLLSFGVYGLFVLFGDVILTNLFQVRLASLQIFGGLIMIIIAYRYVTIGAGSNLLFRGDVTTFAANISIPYMVGAGTVWLSILAGRDHGPLGGLAIAGSVLAVNMAFVITVSLLVERLSNHKDTLLGKYFMILTRTSALFIG
ncbi:MAG: hypothetical protein K8I02_12075, partial [Candidatus Methylomirabilis sp.]|nr:hypothetical protein [Deltaproteobacteria bacterium]